MLFQKSFMEVLWEQIVVRGILSLARYGRCSHAQHLKEENLKDPNWTTF